MKFRSVISQLVPVFEYLVAKFAVECESLDVPVFNVSHDTVSVSGFVAADATLETLLVSGENLQDLQVGLHHVSDVEFLIARLHLR